MSELNRFGVSIENNLLSKFDRLISERGYVNRSEALRDLIRKELVQQQISENKGEAVGTVTIVFNHHESEVTEQLTSVQHDFMKQIISSTHVHLDHHNCLEVIIVKGAAIEIRKIADRLISLKGVKHGNLSLTTTGKIE
ncbi:nickel-responsive transcriptional regulator NikR [candidate division KSB1 bacterium]|nr:nickel-responsive transcriptional regulator NikR [candidate division KSB1 bacterium]